MGYMLLILAGLAALASCATVAPTLTAVPPLVTDVPVISNTTVDDCDDDPDADCWTRPDIDCFGIFEPWSNVHCPLRCGFCQGKLPPCEDNVPYCDRYEDNTCTEETYRIWARNNCRKHCNLCAVPTRPPGSSDVPGTSAAATAGSSTEAPVPATQTTAAVPVTSEPAPSLVSTLARGSQETMVMQGGAVSTPGMCQYKGEEHKEGSRWNDGCTYECSCLDASKNLIVCSDRCTQWQLTAEVSGCKLVQEDNECCQRIECM